MRPATILLVDDEEIQRRLLTAFLERFCCTIHTAADGTEAIRLLRKTRFDLIITDLQMGTTSGMDVVKAARSISPNTLIFMMSGCSESKEIEAAYRYGTNEYLLKPFSMAVLLHRLQKYGLRLYRSMTKLAQSEQQTQPGTCQKSLHPAEDILYT